MQFQGDLAGFLALFAPAGSGMELVQFVSSAGFALVSANSPHLVLFRIAGLRRRLFVRRLHGNEKGSGRSLSDERLVYEPLLLIA
ncbi:hypothetical protein [Oceanisphaera sp. KMM 10153]|uniref:hypothetical protein n=1 Tax=Oceanisphaera submarina TaxID=3390193 RepID=UPI003974E163